MAVVQPTSTTRTESVNSALTDEQIQRMLDNDDHNYLLAHDQDEMRNIDDKPEIEIEVAQEVECGTADEAFIEAPSTIHEDETQEIEEVEAGRSALSDDSGRGSGSSGDIMPVTVDITTEPVVVSPKPQRKSPQTGTSESFPRGVVGLPNLGNTCYMNAGLQCLLNTPALVEYFGTRDYKEMVPPGNKGKLLRIFAWIFNKAWGSSPSSFTGTVGLANFKDALGDCHSDFQGSGQHDCQEFLALLLDTLDDQLKTFLQQQKEAAIKELLDQTNQAKKPSEDQSTPKQLLPLKVSNAMNRPKFKWESSKNRTQNPFPKKPETSSVPRLFTLPDFSARASKSDNLCDDENQPSPYKRPNNDSTNSANALKVTNSGEQHKPPPKRLRMEKGNNDDAISRRKLDYGLEDLKIDDDEEEGTEQSGAGKGSPQVVLPDVVPLVEMEAGTSGNEDKESGDENGKETPTVITAAFEGIMTSTITCSACNHASSLNEPFRYLTLPIPRCSTRPLDINLVPGGCWGDELIYIYTLHLSLDEQVRDIKKHVVDKVKSEMGIIIQMEELELTYVWDSMIKEFLPDGLPVRNINETKALYLYQVDLELFCDPEETSENLCEDTVQLVNPTTGETEVQAKVAQAAQNGKRRENRDCCVCWNDYEPSKLRINVDCECLLCLECLKVCTNFTGDTYKCLKCTQNVRKASLIRIDLEEPFFVRVVFVKATMEGENHLFGFPRLVRLPPRLNSSLLYDYIEELCRIEQLPFDLMVVNEDPPYCAYCGPGCPGCPVDRSGVVELQQGNILVVKLVDKVHPALLGHLRAVDMPSKRNVHDAIVYTYEPDFTIEDCLGEFSRVEKLDNHWLCTQCNKTQEASKSLAISKCPDYLIINLNRFQFEHNTSHKLENAIIFNPSLNLSSYVSEECKQNQEVKYELYACVCHSGSPSYGHYTAYVKNPLTSTWNFCNDSTVFRRKPFKDETIFSSAYVLFYCKQGTVLKPDLQFISYRPRPRPASFQNQPSPQRPHRDNTIQRSSSGSTALSRNKKRQVISRSPLATAGSTSSPGSSLLSSTQPKIARRSLVNEFSNSNSTSLPVSPRRPTGGVLPSSRLDNNHLKEEIISDWDSPPFNGNHGDDNKMESQNAKENNENNREEEFVHFISRHHEDPYYSGCDAVNSIENGNNPDATFTMDDEATQDHWG